jgi:hypothetical protein
VCSKDQATAEGFSPPYALFPGTENFLCLHCHAARLKQLVATLEDHATSHTICSITQFKNKRQAVDGEMSRAVVRP